MSMWQISPPPPPPCQPALLLLPTVLLAPCVNVVYHCFFMYASVKLTDRIQCTEFESGAMRTNASKDEHSDTALKQRLSTQPKVAD